MRRFASVLAVLSAFALFQGPDLLSADPVAQLIFPCKQGLEKKWATFVKNLPTAADVSALLEEDPQGSQLVPWSESRYTSVWSALQRRLTGQADVVAGLRKSQEGEARASLETARSPDDVAEVGAISRRFPWPASVQRALLQAGEKELRRGHGGLARRCFQDVLERAGDADLRARAQVGIWITAGQDERAEALERAFRGIDLEARYPWMGGQVRAGDIREKLRAQESAAAPAQELKTLTQRKLEVPGAPSWVFDCPTASADGAVVAGPNLLAFYAGAETKPSWAEVFPLAASTAIWTAVAPGPFRPALAQGKIFTRWSTEAVPLKTVFTVEAPALLANLAAFDAHTGKQLWSSAALAGWEELCPVADPTHADGRLYLLAVSRKEEISPIYLVCFSAETGALLWKRQLAAGATTLSSRREQVRQMFVRAAGVDVVRFGNPVTVSGGLVYCSTNMGVVACCDARDGLIEWARSYPQDPTAAAANRRQGAAPLVAGGRVFFLPRDAAGAFTLDAGSGELVWTKANEAADQALGVFGGSFILADSQRVAAVAVDTGKTQWERPFADAVAGRTALAGPAVYVGTKSTLYRLDAGTGAVAEEQPWGPDGALDGLVVHGSTLLGTAKSPAYRPPALTEPRTAAGRPSLVIHRSLQPFPVDGAASDWNRFQTFPWTGKDKIEGKLLLAHDGKHFYIGITAVPAGDKPAGLGNRLELALLSGKKPLRWTVSVGADGKAVWEGLGTSVPAAARAVVHYDKNRAPTFELAVPLASVFPEKDVKQPDWGQLGLTLTLAADANAKDANAFIVRMVENVCLRRLTHEQESAGQELALSMPDRNASWELLEEAWRARAAAGADTADLYADFIKRQPKSLAVGRALVRLDQVLRKKVDDDPAGEVLHLAKQAGVPESVRNWYRRAAAAYLSQWVFLDARSQHQSIGIQLFDGTSWEDRVKGQRFPMPPLGVWHELRFPLIWLDLHDQPIGGIAFSQLGGSNVCWDRTAIFQDGKETVLLEDDLAPGEAQGDWRWLAEPVKSGQQAHTTVPPPNRNLSVRHAVYFKDSVRAHLSAEPAEAAFAPKQFLALVETKLPSLPLDAFTRALYERADVLLRPDSDRRGGLRQAILKKADPEDVPGWLDIFLRLEYESGADKAGEAVETMIQSARLPEPVLAEFRKRPSRRFLRGWQVIGPFENPERGGHGVVYPPESEGIDLGKEYVGAKGKVRWQLLQSAGARIDLQKFLDHDQAGVAYAACWVHADARKPALLDVGSHDGIKVWINPRKQPKPVIDEPVRRQSAPAQNSARIDLLPGWNEILIKVDQRAGPWSFFAELRAPDGSRALEGVKAQEERPGQGLK